jgi:hypothetical protein
MRHSSFNRKRSLFQLAVPSELGAACMAYLRAGPWNENSREFSPVDREGFEPRAVGEAFLAQGLGWEARRLLGMPDDLYVSDTLLVYTSCLGRHNDEPWEGEVFVYWILASDGLGLQVGGEVTRADLPGDVIAFDPMRRHAVLPCGRRKLGAIRPQDWDRIWCGIHFVMPRGEFERWTMCLAGDDPLERMRAGCSAHQPVLPYEGASPLVRPEHG